MLLQLASVAATHTEAAHAAESSGVLKIFNDFGIQPSYVLMQFVSFAILAFVLYRFAIKPTLAVMDERNSKIADGLKNAEATAAKLAEAQKEAEARIKEAQINAGKIIDEARKAAKELADREIAAATARANDLITKAQQAIELERRKTLAEAREEIARLVIATTERVLAKKLSDADRAAYNETAAQELTVV
jgi:F-type H+-transporting ATPase subunit b